MTEAQLPKSSSPPAFRRWWLGVYWSGRGLQLLGLLLILEVLLLFANLPDMGTLLFWVGMAMAVFYAGWACTVWARKHGSSRG
jgi:hypothetical protein